jgi:hypothetical protein
MENVWFLASIWVGLALVATLFAIWLKISTALSEIVVGTVAQLIVGVAIGRGSLGGSSEWVTFLAGTGAILAAVSRPRGRLALPLPSQLADRDRDLLIRSALLPMPTSDEESGSSLRRRRALLQLLRPVRLSSDEFHRIAPLIDSSDPTWSSRSMLQPLRSRTASKRMRSGQDSDYGRSLRGHRGICITTCRPCCKFRPATSEARKR